MDDFHRGLAGGRGLWRRQRALSSQPVYHQATLVLDHCHRMHSFFWRAGLSSSFNHEGRLFHPQVVKKRYKQKFEFEKLTSCLTNANPPDHSAVSCRINLLGLDCGRPGRSPDDNHS